MGCRTSAKILMWFITYLQHSSLTACLIYSHGLYHSTPEWLLDAVLGDVFLFAFAGYTVSSVIIGDKRSLYVAGAPRFKHKGKVILFELSDEGDVNIVQALNGEQVKLSLLQPLFMYLQEKTGILFWFKTMAPPSGSKMRGRVSPSVDWILLWQWGVRVRYRPGWHHWRPSGCSSYVPRLREQGGWESLHLHPEWGKTTAALIVLLIYHYAVIMQNISQILLSFTLLFSQKTDNDNSFHPLKCTLFLPLSILPEGDVCI